MAARWRTAQRPRAAAPLFLVRRCPGVPPSRSGAPHRPQPSPPPEQKCKDAGFCERNRGKPTGGAYSIVPGSASAAGATLTASLANSGAPAGAPPLNLTLRAYAGGVVRLVIDEPGADRYQVPDILLPDLEASAVPWAGAAAGKGSWAATAGDLKAELSFAPFKLTVSAGGKVAAVVNSRNLFAFEQRRNKTVRRD